MLDDPLLTPCRHADQCPWRADTQTARDRAPVRQTIALPERADHLAAPALHDTRQSPPSVTAALLSRAGVRRAHSSMPPYLQHPPPPTTTPAVIPAPLQVADSEWRSVTLMPTKPNRAAPHAPPPPLRRPQVWYPPVLRPCPRRALQAQALAVIRANLRRQSRAIPDVHAARAVLLSDQAMRQRRQIAPGVRAPPRQVCRISMGQQNQCSMLLPRSMPPRWRVPAQQSSSQPA